MAEIQSNISLKPYNSFGIDVKAKYFSEVRTSEELKRLLLTKNSNDNHRLILGGGSNILFIQNYNGLVILNRISGISIIDENEESVFVKAGAGEVWHDLVLWCVDRNYGGIENMSLIPGCVGAGPIQNIGAYGAELKDTFFELEAMNVLTGESKVFSREECKFGYRESIFKNKLKGAYIITAVTLRLNKNPVINKSYGSIESELINSGIEKPTIKNISDAVIKIRRSKLPEPAVIGNAGSFFKNPEIENENFQQLKIEHPLIVGYPSATGKIKLSAGWLIEQCGWKGKRVGNTGAHKDQALVLVNYGNATGNEVYSLAMEIRKSVLEKFGVELETEVNLV